MGRMKAFFNTIFKPFIPEKTRGVSEEFPLLEGKYLGQKKPGLAPEIFAPGIITTKAYEFAGTFSPDGKEFYFTREVIRRIGRKKYEINTIMVTKMVNHRWTEPETAFFSGQYFDFEPYISPDGKRLYFGTKRPLEGKGQQGAMHQWILEKTETGWSEPKPLGPPFVDTFVMYITTTKDGTIYFTGDGGIFRSRCIDGKYEKPETLGEAINDLSDAAHPFIAPDESYLIFDARPTPTEEPDLYISFREKDGTWTKAKNMGDTFNTPGEELCASVSPDGKYLFFTREGNIYWADAKIIEEFREE